MTDVLADELFGAVSEPYTAEITTPSGITIFYQDEPRQYLLNGAEVPSNSEIRDVLAKDALVWWGMKIGVAGTLELAANGALGEAGDAWPSAEEMVELLTANKLTVNHVRDKAADRGTSVHRALEAWGRDPRFLPNPETYPEEEQGYVRGLVKFLEEAEPEPLAIEMMVGSVVHGFAGRYDLRCRMPEREICIRKTEKGQKVATFPGGLGMLDLKTSKDVFEDMFLQLAGYEGASVECGYEPTDFQAVLNVGADGRYQLVRSTATFADFLHVKSVYDVMESLKGWKRRKAWAA